MSIASYHDGRVLVWNADCVAAIRSLPADSVDSIVTDPPYGLGFMGKEWDDLPPGEEWARECLRILKPGAHLLAFGGTRTWHRLAAAVEDVGFELRDSIAWLYGSGFPKSMDVSKAIDKAAGAEREVLSEGKAVKRLIPGADQNKTGSWIKDNGREYVPTVTAPATPEAEKWQGWGTALKPAFEPIVVARKPLGEKTVAANVLKHGTGALNIDATRIEHASEADLATSVAKNPGRSDTVTSDTYGANRPQQSVNTEGRWPANVVLDESQAEALGEPSRYFYVAKAPAKERPKIDGVAHPTVKPLTLMRWLVKLVTPPGGLVLDPFGGSGTTGEAALLEGFRCLLIEREADYLPLIAHRMERVEIPAAASLVP